jgi:membrane-bound lytic murein transglycosylase B
MKILYPFGAALLVAAYMLGVPQVVADNTPGTRPAAQASRPEVQVFIAEMVRQHGFDPRELNAVFSQSQAQPDIIAAITRPAEAKPWHAYRKIFLVPRRIQGGVEFWNAHEATLAQAEQAYGVPAEIIVAILGVEYSSHRVYLCRRYLV